MNRPAGPNRRSIMLAASVALLTAGYAIAKVDQQTTRGIIAGLTGKSDRLKPASIEFLKPALDALASGDVERARSLRDILPADSLDRHILAWAIALEGGRLVPTQDISAALDLKTWPGMEPIRRNFERALFREQPAPDLVIRALGGAAPLTSEGVIVLSRAYVGRGDEASARAVLSRFWRMQRLDDRNEIAIVKEFGALIPSADHRFRMERMLYAERIASARRAAGLAGARQLFDAWTAVVRGERSAQQLLEAVPTSQRSAGFLFAEAKALRNAGRYAEAAAIMENAPKDAGSLVDPDAWWIERRVLSRELVDEGDMKTAYDVVASHSAESAINRADAEFHAGWYAFRGLDDAAAGARHFARIADAARGPVSLSRAYYWLGRTAEAGGPGSAKEYYTLASAYGTTFYGQLAAAKIGARSIDVAAPVVSEDDRRSFAGREAVAAIKRLEAAGATGLADALCRDLAGQLTRPGELSLLTAMAEARGNHFLALRIGKIALANGIAIGSLSHPIGVIPASADISGPGAALAYAIARQESEFNVGAVSSAGARGLLQLMPGTAKALAKKAGMPYSADRLSTDAGYNATLGAAFLGEQLGKFDGSYVLTFAGYNAGPKRARQWMARYGDPRGKDLDTVVDWIERIPYAETRGYVQRVMENYQVYKMKLTGAYDIVDDLTNGR